VIACCYSTRTFAVTALTTAQCTINDPNYSTGDNYDVWVRVTSGYPTNSGWLYIGNYSAPLTVYLTNYSVTGVYYQCPSTYNYYTIAFKVTKNFGIPGTPPVTNYDASYAGILLSGGSYYLTADNYMNVYF
jgi:hypothetical protein